MDHEYIEIGSVEFDGGYENDGGYTTLTICMACRAVVALDSQSDHTLWHYSLRP